MANSTWNMIRLMANCATCEFLLLSYLYLILPLYFERIGRPYGITIWYTQGFTVHVYVSRV